MSLNRRLPGLPNAPTDATAQQSQWMQEVTTALRSGLGQSKTQDDKWLTWSDLEQTEIVVKSTKPGGGYLPSNPSPDPPDMTPPPVLQGVEASGGMTAIYVRWDDPALDGYYHIEIHRSAENDVGTAVMVGTTMGNIFQDVVGSDTTTKYYWVRIVKQSGGENIIGPWHSTQGAEAAAASDPDWILGDLEGKIDDSHLNDLLGSEIDKIPRLEIDLSDLEEGLHTETTERKSEDESLHSRIDTNVSRIGDNTAAIITESETRASEDEALAKQITTLAVEVGDNAAAIQTESEVRATEDAALASQITQLQAEVDGEFALIRDEMTVIIDDQQKLAERVSTVELDVEEGRAAIEQQFKVFEDEFENIRAEYTVKLDVDGYVGGFGLVNDGDTITALWRVDVFGVGAPGSEELTFAIDAEENRVVMDGAYIKNASITDAQIGNLNVDKLIGGTAEFVEANIRDASITNAKIGNVIQSNNYQAGRAGWIINKAGFAEFSDVVARGHIDGSIIRGSVIEGGLLIQSDIQITTPTEADKGAGTIRYLSVVTTREHVASFDGDKEVSAETSQLKLVTANYTAEGSEKYGYGEAKEDVYVNFERYLKYSINPEVYFHVKKVLTGKNYGLTYRLKIQAVNYDNSKTDIYETSNATISGSSSGGWFHGTNSDGDWSVYIDVRPIYDNDSGSIIGYSRGLTEAMVTINKRSFNYRDADYKSITATIILDSGTGYSAPRIQNITMKDTLSRYV